MMNGNSKHPAAPATPWRRAICMPAAALCVLAWSGPGFAASGYQIGTGVNYSDNITRSPVGDVDDTVGNVRTGFLWNKDSGPLTADVFGQLTYLDYFQDTFDEEVLPSLQAGAEWNMIPARLTWTLSDRFGQITTDPFEAITPENRENINHFSTGPDFFFGSSRAQTLMLSLRLEDQSYEESEIDNQRMSGELVLERQLSKERAISLHGSVQAVEFDNAMLNTDYDVYEAFARYNSSLLGSLLQLDLGFTQLEINDETSDGILTRLSLTREIGPHWSVQVSGERAFSDAGNRFLAGREESSAGAGQGTSSAIAIASPLQVLDVDFDVSRRGSRTELGMGFFWEDEDFETTNDFDRRQIGGTLGVNFAVTPLSSVIAGVNYQESEFASGFRMDEDLDAVLRLRRRLSRNFSIDLQVAHAARVSNVESAEYRELVYGISFTYAAGLLETLQSTLR